MYNNILAYGYNTQIHRITNCTPLELVLRQPPHTIVMQSDPDVVQGESHGSCLYGRKLWLNHLVQNAGGHMLHEQHKYQRCLIARERPTKEQLKIGSFIFVYCSHTQHGQITPKLCLTVNRPYEVMSLKASTVTTKDGPNIKRVFRDRIAQSLITASCPPVILNDASQATVNSNARTSFEQNSPQPDPGDVTSECFIDRRSDCGIVNDRSPLFRVQWYGYGPEDDTWEPVLHLSGSHIVHIHRLRNLPLLRTAIFNRSQVV